MEDAKETIMSQTCGEPLPEIVIEGDRKGSSFDRTMAFLALLTAGSFYIGIAAVYLSCFYSIHVILRRSNEAVPLWIALPLAIMLIFTYLLWPKRKRLYWQWISPKKHDSFKRLCKSAATKVGSRTAEDSIFLPDHRIDVFCLSSLPLLPLASGEVIAIGLLTLEQLSTQELKVLLGRSFALRKRQSGFARWYLASFYRDIEGLLNVYPGMLNPIRWLFLIVRKLFLLLLAPSFKREELEADQDAAKCYGSNVLATTLENYYLIAGMQEKLLENYMDKPGLVKSKSAPANIYKELLASYKKRMEREESRLRENLSKAPSSSRLSMQPMLSERLEAIDGGEVKRTGVRRAAWSLFDDKEEIQEQMSELLWQREKTR